MKTNTLTDLEQLIVRCQEYKKEIFEFLGITFLYEKVNTTNDLPNNKWLEQNIDTLNTNLKKENISLFITKSANDFSKNPNFLKSEFLPSFHLLHPEFNIDIIVNNFHDKFVIYNNRTDFLQIEPSLKLITPFNKNQYELLKTIFETVTSELTQYTYLEKNKHHNIHKEF